MASKEGTAEGKGDAVQRKAEDNELSALLDEALEDFKKFDIGGKEAEADSTSKSEQGKESVEGASGHSPANPILAEYIENEEFQKLAEEFTKALDGMPEQDLDALQNFGRMVLTENFASGDVNPTEMEDSLSRAFDALKQNMKDVEGNVDSEFDGHLLDSIKNMGFGEGGEEGFFEMMQGFMKELLSKEVIYPSLKEMATQYPSWLDENKSSLPTNEHERYKSQYEVILELCESFEKDTETETEDEKKARFENHLLLIQKMQKCGQPPTDLMNKVMKDANESGELSGAAAGECSIM